MKDAYGRIMNDDGEIIHTQCFNCGRKDTIKRQTNGKGFPLCEDCFSAEYPDQDWAEGIEEEPIEPSTL